MFNGVKEYVTQCQQSETTYAHQVETAGWEPHDDQLFAYQKSTIYIMAPSGRYNVVTSEVVDGTPQMAYTFESDGSQASGEYYYEDCSRFERVNTVENYKRPDGTIYPKPIGEGTPIGPVHACQNVIAASWPKASQSSQVESKAWLQPCPDPNALFSGKPNSRYYNATWSATMKLVREDGEIVSTASKTYSAQCGGAIGTSQSGATTGWGGSGTAYCYAVSVNWSGASPSCEATMDFAEDEQTLMINFATSQGWTGQSYRFE